MPPTPQISGADLRRSRDDAAVFARILCRAPLWPHQREVAASAARYAVICSARRSGKTRLVAVLALWTAFRKPGASVLIISAGEVAARRTLAEVAGLLAGSALLRGSVTDELAGKITLSSGSVIESVPASQKQIRGVGSDLTVIDECGFVDESIWRAAEPTILDRPGSRVILCSTPWGGPDHFFRRLWRQGMDRPDERVRSWHWPSTVSPLVDRQLLAEIQERESADYFAREYLAEWTDEAGSYFTEAEIMGAVADFPLREPGDWRRTGFGRPFAAAGGLDWGFSRDANALVLVSVLEDEGVNGRDVFYIPWLESHFGMEYSAFVDRVAKVNEWYSLQVVASECNGVGAAPTQDLQRRFADDGRGGFVVPVWTDARRKMSGFGRMRGMLQRGSLILPRHPQLLSELRGLESELLPSGMTRIAAGGRGHDDLPMAAMQAVSCLVERPPGQRPVWAPQWAHTVTARGMFVPVAARPRERYSAPFCAPSGMERSTENAW